MEGKKSVGQNGRKNENCKTKSSLIKVYIQNQNEMPIHLVQQKC